MARRRMVAVRIVAAVVATVFLLVAGVIAVLTATDWGRERVRSFAVERLAAQVDGRVRIEGLSGDLLSGAVMENVLIEDSAGAPFLRADTIAVRYSLRSFLSRDLIFHDVRLVRPVLVLAQSPDGEWNFARLFGTDTTPAAPAPADAPRGFGSRVRLEDMTVEDGTVVVRTAWSPPDTLRASGAVPAFAANQPGWIVPLDGEWQRLALVRNLDAELPLVRLADPDSAALVFELASASMQAYPVRPPAVDVRDVSGRIEMDEDSVRAENLAVALPGTRMRADGTYALASGAFDTSLEVESLSFDDFRWLAAELPEGGGSGEFAVTHGPRRTRIAGRDVALTLDSGRVAGSFDVQIGDTLRIGEADIVVEGLDTRTLERVAGAAAVPVDGVVGGALRLAGDASELEVDGHAELRERSGRTSRVRADGVLGSASDGGLSVDGLTLRFEPLQASLARSFAPDLSITGAVTGVAIITGSTRTSFDVDADLAHEGGAAGRSRVLADGNIEMTEELNARDLRLRFAPLRIGLIETLAGDLPVGGIVEGGATLNGSPTGRLHARLDVEHTAETGTSRVEGTAVWRAGGAFDLDLELPALALATVGSFAEAAQLHGTASGRLSANGTTSRFGFAADLTLADSGRFVAAGTLDLRAGSPAYEVRADLAALDLGEATLHVPETRLTGQVDVRGQGTDLAAMTATIAADLVDTHLGGTTVDTSRIRARLADGVATIDRAELRLASAAADLEGAIGLVEGRTGELRYRIDVPRLGDFAQYVPGDTGAIPPRPVAQARRVAEARADSLERALATEVRRAATGYPAAPTISVDSVRPLGQDSVAGRIVAEGSATGSLARLALRGTAQAEDLVAAGATVRRARASYTLTDFGTPDADATLELAADSPAVAGFAFDSAGVQLSYAGVRERGNGTLELELWQDPARDYRLTSDFRLELDRREMTFNELVLRFDTVSWIAPHSGALAWGGPAIELDSLELLNASGEGRIEIDGRIATEAASDLTVEIENLPLAQIAGLLQDTLSMTGLVNLDARMSGTAGSPQLEGTLALSGATLEERPLPDFRAGFDYTDMLLRAEAELHRADRPMLSARARLPVNLALSGVEGPRLLDRQLGIEARADSLPLEALPGFTDAVQDVRGRVRGDVVVGGTWDEPVLNGGIDLDLASLRIVPAGVWLRDIAGAVVLEGDAITVDSLVAQSGGGPIRVTGRMDVERLTAPAFDLRLSADDAVVFDTDRGRVRTDATLTMTGPMDSARIEGEVHVQNGRVVIPDLGESKRVTPLDDASVMPLMDSTYADEEILPAPNPLLQNLRADIGVRVARDMWVRNSDAAVEIYTPDEADPLRVRYNVDQPGLALEGVIHADRGEYEFAGRVFNMTTGAVTFLPGDLLNPLVQLTANYEVARRGREALVIQIHLTGSLREPRIALESTAEPPLSESDLLSYLAFGRATSSVLDFGDAGLTGGSDGSGGIGAVAQQQIAGLALGTAVDNAIESLERRGGRTLDVFRIQPAPLPDELAFASAFDNFLRGTEVTAGKYLTSGLFVAAEGRTTTETWPGLRAEYQTTTGFSWRVTWESRFLPVRPSFTLDQVARSARVLGTFLYWSRRF